MQLQGLQRPLETEKVIATVARRILREGADVVRVAVRGRAPAHADRLDVRRGEVPLVRADAVRIVEVRVGVAQGDDLAVARGVGEDGRRGDARDRRVGAREERVRHAAPRAEQVAVDDELGREPVRVATRVVVERAVERSRRAPSPRVSISTDVTSPSPYADARTSVRRRSRRFSVSFFESASPSMGRSRWTAAAHADPKHAPVPASSRPTTTILFGTQVLFLYVREYLPIVSLFFTNSIVCVRSSLVTVSVRVVQMVHLSLSVQLSN